MYLLSLSLLFTFSAHNFSVPITTILPENTINPSSIVRFQNQHLTSFAKLEKSSQSSFRNKNKIEIFEAKNLVQNRTNRTFQTLRDVQSSDLQTLKLESENDKKISVEQSHQQLKITQLGKTITTKNLKKILPKIPKNLVKDSNSPNLIIPNLIKPVQKPMQNTINSNSLDVAATESLLVITNQNTNQLSNSVSNSASNSVENETQNSKIHLTVIPIINSSNSQIESSSNNSVSSSVSSIISSNLEQNPIQNQINSKNSVLENIENIQNIEKKSIPIPIPKNQNSSQNSIQNTDLNQMIIEKCQKYGCDANKMLKVVKCESGGRNVTGIGGHIGPFQFTNRTFYAFAAKYGVNNPDIWNVTDQVEVATQMFAQGLGKQHWSCF